MRTIIALLILPASAIAQVPVTFTPGTPALASEVNQNFTELDTRINANFDDLDSRVNSSIGGIIISGVTATDGSGVAAAVCPSDRIAISANCHCDNEGGTRNFGVLFGCQVSGNGGVAGCFNQGATFDPSLPSPMATVVVGCVSAVTNDGTPIDPVPIAVKGTSSAQKSGSSITTLNASSDLETTLQSMRNQVADQRTRLESKQ